MLPEWYTFPAPCKYQSKGRRAGAHVRRAISSFGEALALDLSGMRTCSGLSKINPGVKILSTLALIVVATLLQGMLPLFLILLMPSLFLLFCGRGRGLARMWVGVPLFSLFVILPAATSLVTAGTPVLLLCKPASFAAWMPDAVYITREGLFVAGRFLLRSTACVTLSFALVTSTGSTELMAGLRSLGIPGIFGMVFSMMQRYLSLMLRAAQEIHMAKLSRTIQVSPAREREWVAAGVGTLFRKTHNLSTEVYKAMVSRGFDGGARPAQRFRPAFADFMFAATILLIAGGVMALDRTALFMF